MCVNNLGQITGIKYYYLKKYLQQYNKTKIKISQWVTQK